MRIFCIYVRSDEKFFNKILALCKQNTHKTAHRTIFGEFIYNFLQYLQARFISKKKLKEGTLKNTIY